MPNFVISQAMHSIRSYIEDACSRFRNYLRFWWIPTMWMRVHWIELPGRPLDNGVGSIPVGGSPVTGTKLPDTIARLKPPPTCLWSFFRSVQQVDPQADALLFLSLISGRNPDLLIGNQVLAAPM